MKMYQTIGKLTVLRNNIKKEYKASGNVLATLEQTEKHFKCEDYIEQLLNFPDDKALKARAIKFLSNNNL